MSDTRFIQCRSCLGEGECGNEYWHGKCEVCHGSGVEEIEAEPVTMEDLEERDAAIR